MSGTTPERYPLRSGATHKNSDLFDTRYPADFICEAIDQTRGWFYADGCRRTRLRSVVVSQCAVPRTHPGRRRPQMSKHLGNVIEPMALMDRHGADGVRWFMLAAGSAWSSRRVSDDTINEVVRRLCSPTGTASFLSLYGRIANSIRQTQRFRPFAERSSLDRWALSSANDLIAKVHAALDGFDTQLAGRLLSNFIDDLSTGTSGALGGGSGTATSPRCRPFMSPCERSRFSWRRLRHSSPTGCGVTSSRYTGRAEVRPPRELAPRRPVAGRLATDSRCRARPSIS